MTTIILHCGLHKTATTSIQLFMEEKANQLKDKQVFYPDFEKKYYSNHSIPFHIMFSKDFNKHHIIKKHDREFLINEKKHLLNYLKDKISSSKWDKIIFSGEDISLLDCDELGDLKAFFENHFRITRFKIVIYIRNPLDWSISNSQELLKHGLFSLNQIFNLPYCQGIEAKLMGIEQVFNRHNVTVRSYDNVVKKRGDVLIDFLETIGLDQFNLLVKRVKHSASIANKSLSLEKALVFDSLITHDKDSKLDFLNHLSSLLPNEGANFCLPEVTLDRIKDEATPDLIFVKKNYGIEFESFIKRKNEDINYNLLYQLALKGKNYFEEIYNRSISLPKLCKQMSCTLKQYSENITVSPNKFLGANIGKLFSLNSINNQITDKEINPFSEAIYVLDLIKSKNTIELVVSIKELLTKDTLEFFHPLKPSLLTQALFSERVGMVNYIFFCDTNGDSCWILAQVECFIDNIILSDGYISYAASQSLHPCIKNSFETFLNLLSTKEFFSVNKFKGIMLSQLSPYHFFYDQYVYFRLFAEQLKKKQILIQKKHLYFSPDVIPHINTTYDNDGVFVYPCVIGGNHLVKHLCPTYLEARKSMELFIYQNALEACEINLENTYDFILWIGITGQKRAWLNQIEGYSNIVNELSLTYPRILLFIDGMTAADGETLNVDADNQVSKAIQANLKSSITTVELIGKDYKTKITFCSKADAFIANAGSGCMVPLRFCKKPGILHSNSKLYTFPDNYPETMIKISSEHIFDKPSVDNERIDCINYDIHYQHIYNALAHVIKLTKGDKIRLLEVPNHLNFKKYKTETFQGLKEKITIKSEPADILREVAFCFELNGDIKTAYALMKQAHLLRPNGPLILAKYEQYLSQLQKNNKAVIDQQTV